MKSKMEEIVRFIGMEASAGNKTKLHFMRLLILAGVSVTLSMGAAAELLSPRNNGKSVIGNLPVDDVQHGGRESGGAGYQFDTVVDNNGNILYFYNTGGHMGFCMGRYQIAGKKWELWTSKGWSSASNAVPLPIGESFFSTSFTRHGTVHYNFLRLTPASQDIFAVVAGMSKIGKNDFDVHGNPFNFIFDGTRWQSLFGNRYDPQRKSPLINLWGEASNFAFASNGRGQGLMTVVGLGHWHDSARLYAARFDQDKGPENEGHLWAQWRDSSGVRGWHSHGTLKPVFQNQSFSNWFPGNYSHKIIYAGVDADSNDIYLTSYRSRAYKYNDGPKEWWIWNNNQWELETGQTAAQQITSTNDESFDHPGGFIRWGDEILLIHQDVSAGPVVTLHVIKTAGTKDFNWTQADAPLPGVPPLSVSSLTPYPDREQKGFAILNDPAGDVVVYYLTHNTGLNQVELHRITYDGAWGPPSPALYSTPEDPASVKLLGAVFTRPEEGSLPVIFIKEGPNTLCLSQAAGAIWSGEQAMENLDSVPPRAPLDSSRFRLVTDFSNTAGSPPFYYNQNPWFLTQDADGYLYAPENGFGTIIVHPPGAISGNNSVFWGYFWEKLAFPGAVAVDDTRGQIYFTDRLDSGGGGGYNGGQLRWLDKQYRDEFIFNTNFGGESPPGGLAIPFHWTSAKLATGMILDEEQGVIYLASALTGQVFRYETLDANGLLQDPQNETVFLSGLAGPVGMVRDEDGRFYIVESLAHRISTFEADGTYVSSFGEVGRGPGQFVYPTQITYSKEYGLFYVADPLNERIQVFDRNWNFITAWGTWRGTWSPSFPEWSDCTYLGGLFAKGRKLVVGTGRTYGAGYVVQFQIMDNPPQSALITSPPSGGEVGTLLPISFSASDDWGFVRADLLEDGVAIDTMGIDRVRDVSASLDWTAKRGPHTIEVLLTDIAGHTITTPPVQMTGAPPKPVLVSVMNGLGKNSDEFISPLGEDVELKELEIEVSIPLNENSSGALITNLNGGATPRFLRLKSKDPTNSQNRKYIVQMDAGAPLGEWIQIDLTVNSQENAENTLTLYVAHLPCDVNEDGQVSLSDATAFGQEFGKTAPSLDLIDMNDDGQVNLNDATRWGQHWNGTSEYLRWQGESLLPSPRN